MLVIALGAAPELTAARKIGFETDAFNRAYPTSYAKNFVFSPLSFELDCAAVAESLETIPKANVSETLGATIGFESVYRPVVEAYESLTNRNLMIAARGFCVAEIRKTRPVHRQHLERLYRTEIMSQFPTHGAESWFRAAMEGEMEDFSLPIHRDQSNRYSFFDLVSVDIAWAERFPTENTRKIRFRPSPEAEPISVDSISDVRLADTWETKKYTMIRLPLQDNAWFYAFLPREEAGFEEIRADISSLKIDRLLTIHKAVSEPGVAFGPCAIVLPKFTLRSRVDFTPVLTYFRVPLVGLTGVAPGATARAYVQHAKVSLAEQGRGELPLAKKAAKDVVPITDNVKKLIFNRPFLFFVYHEPTQTIPIAGQFCGH